MTRARVVVALAAVLAACARERITETHGLSYRAVLQAQTANPTAKARPPKGLDAQESTIVAEEYLRSLAPKGDEAKESPIVVLSPPRQGAPQPLMPSVPK
jgi:hypothetical protein